MTTDSTIQSEARERAYSLPLDQIDPSAASLFEDDTIHHYFERLRNEAPVHRGHSPLFGEFWSITRYQDIMAVDTNHAAFSSESEYGTVAIVDRPASSKTPMFIAMDPPRHDEQRKAVSPIVAPANLANMEPLIRERTRKVLDALPRNETFNWVERVSIELTTMMLATLLDFPFEERHLLPYWSDVITSVTEQDHMFPTEEARFAEVLKMGQYLSRLWAERVNSEPRSDLISMMAHHPITRDLSAQEKLGNLMLLVVGGNDTTRNSMSGGVLALHENPGEFAKLKANPALVESLVPEIIRWQTPLAHMRRTAVADIEMGGKTIRAGDKVVMWYLSGNRDERVIDDPYRFIIDRERPRQHLSFGFGIHRCVGNRLAELQLRILWEEILARFSSFEVVAPPVRVRHNFVRGFTQLMVRLPG